MKKENKYLGELREMIKEFFQDKKTKVYLFGSRARGDNYISSDVDIGILPQGKLKKEEISLLRERIENSCIPYKVEIVNLEEAGKGFLKEVLKDAVVWKD